MANRPKRQAHRRLNLLRDRFIREYFSNGMNASAAARSCGITKHPGQWAERLLKQPETEAMIERIRAHIVTGTNIDTRRVLDELAQIAFANPDDFLNRDGERPFVDLSRVTRSQLAAVSSVESDVVGQTMVVRTKLRFYDKVAALKLAGEYLKMFSPKIGDQSVESLAEMMRLAHERERNSDGKTDEAGT